MKEEFRSLLEVFPPSPYLLELRDGLEMYLTKATDLGLLSEEEKMKVEVLVRAYPKEWPGNLPLFFTTI